MNMQLRKPIYRIQVRMPNGHLKIMNTLWRSAVQLDPEEQEFLRDQVSHSKRSRKRISKGKKDALSSLLELGILTYKSKDEEMVEAVNQLKRWQNVGKVLHFTYAPTFACNFRCSYCIQRGNYDSIPTISYNMNKQIANFMKEFVIKKRLQRIICNLFGGEPTLAYKKLIHFVKLIDDLSKKFGLKPPDFQIVTNGYSLDSGMLQELKKYGLSTIQITLDGLRKTHNRRRPHVSGLDTFDKIVENICISTSLGIRTNLLNVLDSENVMEMHQLVDHINALHQDNRQMNLKKHLIFCFFSVIPSRHTRRRNERLLYGQEKLLEGKIAEARKYAKKNGFGVNDPFTVEVCFRELPNSFLVDPNGLIYKCYSILGDKNYAIGRIGDDVEQITAAARKWYDFLSWDEECLHCPIFPICHGGCEYLGSQLHNGEYKHKYCQKELLLYAYKKNLEYGIL